MAANTVHIEAAVDGEPPSFWAVSGRRQVVGRTPGEALDLLRRDVPDGLTEPLVVLPRNVPDAFIDAELAPSAHCPAPSAQRAAAWNTALRS